VNSSSLRTLLVCFLAVFPGLNELSGNRAPETFSADFTLTSPAGEELVLGKIYVAWPKLRMDANDVQHGVTASAIVDYLAQKAIALLPQYRTYVETSIDQQKASAKSLPPVGPGFDASNPCAGHDNWSCKKTATQTIAGRQCDVWEIVSDKTAPMTAWIDTKLNFPIKTKLSDGYILEYTNIQEGQQPAPTLFQVPPGYKKSTEQPGPTPAR